MLVPALLSEEHEALSESLRGLLARRRTPQQRAASCGVGAGHDQVLWAELVRQLELPGLAVPEEYGGAGFGPFEAFLVAAELGRVLAPVPYFSVAGLAINLVLEVGTPESCRSLLPRLCDGSLLATAALAEGDEWSPSTSSVQAIAVAGGYTLTGTKRFVTDGARADVLLVSADLDGQLALLAVDVAEEQQQPEIESLETLDLNRPQAHVRFSGTPARLLSAEGADVAAGLRRALDAAGLVLVGEACGAAEHLLESATDYARSRQQFGRPIGSFQAIKHKLADLAFDVERMWTAGLHAARTLASTGEAAAEISLARAFCAEAYFRVAAENIQVHGGIGYTWEHEAHLYFRHAKSLEFLLGTPAQARERLVSLLEAASV